LVALVANMAEFALGTGDVRTIVQGAERVVTHPQAHD
jgi:hypothetical protein